jgi:glycosyltransferase involved in cell wall biosynthesis
MRILRLIHTLNPAVGGPIESVRQSSAALRASGHEVEVVTLDAAGASWLTNIPFPVHTLGPSNGYGYSSQLIDWIRQRRADFDAVLVHGVWQYIGVSAWRALRNSSTPYFVFPHGMLDPWFAQRYPLKHLKKMLYWPVESRVLRNARAVLFTSEEERRQAHRSFFRGNYAEEVVAYGTAPPKVDLVAARERFLQSFPALRSKRIFLFLGRLHNKKGCDLLIEAFASATERPAVGDELQLVLAGPADSSYLEELKGIVSSRFPERNAEASRVAFTGMLEGDLKWGAFAAAEVFVLPSHQENFGIAVAESLACGTPVLISNKVNIWREIVEDGAGFADDDTVAGTKRLIERWLGTSEDARAGMRQSALKCFAERFHIQKAVDSLVSVLSRPPVRQ